MPRDGRFRIKDDDLRYTETRGRSAQIDRKLDLEEEKILPSRSRQLPSAAKINCMTKSAAGTITEISASPYTSSAVSLNVLEDAACGMVAGPTFLREFGRIGGASNDVESRPQPVTTAALPFRTKEHMREHLLKCRNHIDRFRDLRHCLELERIRRKVGQ